MPSPSPRSLALDLISTLRGESMPVGALVAAGALFGIPENGMRVAITRLLGRGRASRATSAAATGSARRRRR